MNAATRRRITSGTDQADLTGGNACWQTPPVVFNWLNDRFRFDVDLCADVTRALLPVWFGPGSEFEEDALTAPWHEFGEFGFCNPPYGAFVAPVLRKAAEEARCGFTSLHLIPLRMNSGVREAVFRSGQVSRVMAANRRITFFENGAPRRDAKGNPMPALFDSMLLVFEPGRHPFPVLVEWDVPVHVSAEFKGKGRKQAA